MTDLTEQMKKGELPSADENHTWLAYYLKQASGRINADSYWRGNWGHADRNSIIKVLAPVPSYEEWQASEKYNKHLEEVIKIYERKDKQATETSIAYNELLEENAQLKELLKECKEWLDYLGIYKYTEDSEDCIKLLSKLKEVLK